MICSPNEKNIAGQKFGKLTAIQRDFSKENKRLCWFFRCDCGNVKSIGKNNVVNSNTTSCGCYVRETTKRRMTIHGLVYHELYETWSTMKKDAIKIIIKIILDMVVEVYEFARDGLTALPIF